MSSRAKVNPQEGFAEFGRMLHTSKNKALLAIGYKTIYPKASSFFVSKDIYPKTE